jgi:hypothetical protein
VAERIEAPLYKMELGTDSTHRHKHRNDGARHMSYDSEDEGTALTIEEEFRLAARWNAVLLIDECDTYLEKRRDDDAKRNKIVSSMNPLSFSSAPRSHYL